MTSSSQSLIRFFLLAGLGMWNAASLQAQWDGDSRDGFTLNWHWSNSGNWNNAIRPTDGPTAAVFGSITPVPNVVSTVVTLTQGGADAASALTFNAGANAYTFNGDALSLSGSLTNSSTSQQTFNSAVTFVPASRLITNTTTGSLNFNGAVSNAGQTLTVNNTVGAGVVTFNSSVSASNVTLSGPGTVRFASGSTSTVTAGAGSRMEGVGSVSGLTTIQTGATYSAGLNGIGTQTHSAGLTFGSNSNFVWDLSATAGVDSFDTVNVQGPGLSIGSGFSTVINLTGGANVALNDSWDVFTSSTPISNLAGSLITVNGANPNGRIFQWSVVGNTGRITAVPEPSSMALLGMAGLVGGAYARRRAKKNRA